MQGSGRDGGGIGRKEFVEVVEERASSFLAQEADCHEVLNVLAALRSVGARGGRVVGEVDRAKMERRGVKWIGGVLEAAAGMGLSMPETMGRIEAGGEVR